MEIAILGAGTGGVATAIALAKQGNEINLYERSETVSTMGVGIVLWPNASFALKQLGLLDAVRSVSGKLASMKRINASSENLGVLDIARINKLMGQQSYSMAKGMSDLWGQGLPLVV